MKNLTGYMRQTGLYSILIFLTITGTLLAQNPEPRAVYDYKKWDCQISGNKFTLTTSIRITINNTRGQEYNLVSFDESSFYKVKKARIRVLDKRGEEIYKRKKKDLTRACGFGVAALYEDVCNYFSNLEAPHYPYTIEYEYTLESKSLFFWRGVNFQHRVPVKHARYDLTAPTDFVFDHKVYGLEIVPVVAEAKGGKVTYTWEARDVPPLEDIDYLPAGTLEPARVEFMAAEYDLDGYSYQGGDWRSIGHWYAELARDQYLEPDLAPPTSAMSVPIDAIQVAYNEVARNVRYVAIQIGVGGWQPYPARTTAGRGYGDCKDMATLLISRLRSKQVTAWPVLVRIRDLGPIDPNFPYLNFNHVIAMAVVGGDTLWMDPTCSTCPLGDLPLNDEDITVLVIDDTGGNLRRTPVSTPEENLRHRVTQLHVDAQRRITFSASLEVIGNYAQRLRYRLSAMNRDETRRYVNRIFEGAEKKYRIDNYRIRNVNNPDEPLIVSIEAGFVRPADMIGATIYCDPFFFRGLYSFEQENLTGREYPLKLYYPDVESDLMEITWDAALQVDSVALPEADTMLTSFGWLHVAADRSGDTVTVSYSRACTQYALQPSQFEEFETFRSQVRKTIGQHVKLIGPE